MTRAIFFETILPILILASAVVFVTKVYKYLITKRDSLSEEEKQLKPLHVEYGGGRFGSTNLSMPFVRLAIYSDFIIISYVKKIRLALSDIRGVEVKNHIISNGVHIYHFRLDLPQIIIWSTNCARLKGLIEIKIEMHKQLQK